MDFKDLKILCVDDEETFLKMLKRQLSCICQYSVDTALSVTQALNLNKQHKYDVIVTDQNMELNLDDNLNGTDLINSLKDNNFNGHIIILTKEDILSLSYELHELRKAGVIAINKGNGSLAELSCAIHAIMCKEVKKRTGDYILSESA